MTILSKYCFKAKSSVRDKENYYILVKGVGQPKYIAQKRTLKHGRKSLK